MTPGAETKLWQRLADVDLVQGAMPPDDALGTHWAIRVMLGVSAWVAAVLLLGVVGLLLDFHVGDGTLLLVLGGLQVGGAYLLLGRGEAGVFAGQFALALSIAGQLLVLLGLQQLFQWDLRAFGFAAALLEAGLFLAVPGGAHRVWSAATACLALLFAVDELRHTNLWLGLVLGLFAFVWVHEFRLAWRRELIDGLGYGLLLVIALLLASGSIDMGGLRSTFDDWGAPLGGLALGPLLGATLIAVVVMLTVHWTAAQQRLRWPSGGASLWVTGAIVAFASLWAPGIGVAFVVLLIGFAHGNRLLLAVGIAGGLVYLSHYYYALRLALLYKATLLCATGMLLLAARQFSRHSGKQAEHATEVGDA